MAHAVGLSFLLALKYLLAWADIEAMLVDRTPVYPPRWHALREELKAKLGAPVSDELIELALTHPSAVGEGAERTLKSNQRLEFLGDTILGAVAAEHLYRSHADQPEGVLTQRKASLVQKTTLARVARRLGLGKYLILGRGESNAGGARRDTILSDALEAVLAVVFLSGGLEAARAFFVRWFEEELDAGGEPVNIKNRLQEWTQANGWGTPVYATTGGEGGVHERRYTAHVLLHGLPQGQGEGRSKKDAECQAAQRTLESLLARAHGQSSQEQGPGGDLPADLRSP
jgi:ribonuclease-3